MIITDAHSLDRFLNDPSSPHSHAVFQQMLLEHFQSGPAVIAAEVLDKIVELASDQYALWETRRLFSSSIC
jgi:hypothetical protein